MVKHIRSTWQSFSIHSFTYSDEAMKQLLLKLNAEQEPFIVEDLDETHVLIDRSSVDRLKEKFAMALEENVYKLSDGQEVKSTW